jgi:cytochrome c oxidase cbb3-type subunit 2
VRALESTKSAALLAGVFCYFLAFGVIVASPELMTDQSEPRVVGEDGVARDVKPYTAAEARGRETYGKQVCWHCHSQFVRPVNDEVARWGPVSQTGEYAHDVPHFFGTRRIGPDLHREGGLRPDDWHIAHFADPRFTVPRSVMPTFDWLFYEQPDAARGKEILALLDTDGDGVYSPKLGGDSLDDPTSEVKKARDEAKAFDRWGVRRPFASLADEQPLSFRELPESTDNVLTDYDMRTLPTPELLDLVTYVQRLGTNIGKWRRPLYVSAPTRVSPFLDADPHPRRSKDMRVYGFLARDPAKVKAGQEATARYQDSVAAWDERYPRLARRLSDGKSLFDKHCAGCHGLEGRGNGAAAPWLNPRPRDFTLAKYKFRSTPVGSLPLDGDLFRSIRRGLPGTAMPTWQELSDEQVWLLVDYLKTFYEGTNSFNDRSLVTIAQPVRRETNPAKELARGRAIYLSGAGQCFNCHGKQGSGDGPGWNDTQTDWGGFFRPRDFRPRLKKEWSRELWTLLGRSCERLLGADAWKTASARAEWRALEPSTPERQEAFRTFLLGEGPRLFDVLGGEAALKPAFGDDRYDRLFGSGRDALDEVRMAVATEKEQPALRFRGGAAPEDIYRSIFNGIDGTGMKGNFDQFWKQTEAKLPWRDDLSRKDRRFLWTAVVGTEVKLSYLTNEPALREVGVVVKKDEKGQDMEYVTFSPGDDWALVHYVMWLSCIPVPRAGD